MKPAGWVSVATALVICAISGGASAQPAPQVACEFYEIGASNDKAPSSDAALPPILTKRLQRPAFSKQWNTFKLMSKNEKTLAKKKPQKFALKDGGATAELVELVDKSKARMNLTLEDSKGKTLSEATQLVDAGDWVIVVYVANNNDGHLLAGSCK